MWPDRVSNPGPPTYESGALPIALRGPAVISIPENNLKSPKIRASTDTLTSNAIHLCHYLKQCPKYCKWHIWITLDPACRMLFPSPEIGSHRHIWDILKGYVWLFFLGVFFCCCWFFLSFHEGF